MVSSSFIEALAKYAADQGDCSLLADELAAVRKQIEDGESGRVTSMTVNGKSFSFDGEMTIEQKFVVLTQALEACQCRVGDLDQETFQKTGQPTFTIKH